MALPRPIAKEDLEYLRLLATTLLLLLFVPLVVWKVWQQPGKTVEHAIGGVVK